MPSEAEQNAAGASMVEHDGDLRKATMSAQGNERMEVVRWRYE
jgi:hypothetical protein